MQAIISSGMLAARSYDEILFKARSAHFLRSRGLWAVAPLPLALGFE